MSTSITISGLNNLILPRFGDFIPIVQSGSANQLTTFRTSISTLNGFFAISGSTLSSSWASSSISSSHATLSDSASYLFPTFVYQATSSRAVSSSFATTAYTASISTTSSFSTQAANASFATSASIAATASYLFPNLTYRTTASWAINAQTASTAITSSFLTNIPPTISASYAGTSSNLIYPNTSTASFAISASFLVNNTGFNLTLLNGEVNLNPANNGTWNTVNLTGLVPTGTRYAYIFISCANKDTIGFIRVRTSSGVDINGHIVAGPYGGSDGAENGWAFAAMSSNFVKLTNSLTFDYNFTNVIDTSFFLYLIGYVV